MSVQIAKHNEHNYVIACTQLCDIQHCKLEIGETLHVTRAYPKIIEKGANNPGVTYRDSNTEKILLFYFLSMHLESFQNNN